MLANMLPAGLLLLAYLIGSIPFSFLVVKAFTGADIRQHGSRNVGATNVARTFGKLPGIIALLLDLTKGYAAVELARWIVSRPEWPFAAISPSAYAAASAHRCARRSSSNCFSALGASSEYA